MAGLSAAYAKIMLDYVFLGATPTRPSAIYVSLHTADPGLTGASELSTTNTGYSRQALTWNAAASKAVTNSGTASQTLSGSALPATITYLGVWDAATGGNFIWGWPVNQSQTYNSGAQWSIAAGAETLTLN